MNFFGYLDQVLFGTEHVAFSSRFSIEEATARLAAFVWQPSIKYKLAYLRSRFTGRQHDPISELIGKVSDEQVLIFRHRRGLGRTQFRPIFKGNFVVEDNQTVLKGTFSMALSTKLITVLWVGFSVYLLIPSAQSGDNEPVPFFFPVSFLSIFFIFYGFGRWISRDDRDFIAGKLKNGLNA